MAIAIDLTPQSQDMSDIQAQLDALLGLSEDTEEDTEVADA